MKKKLYIDFETFSEVDITKHGAEAYTRHESTIPICLSWAFETGPVLLWVAGEKMPEEIQSAVSSKDLKIYAHNAIFDWRIWNRFCVPHLGWPQIPIDQLIDTQALCQGYALPGSLDKAGQAMNLEWPKTAGKALIKRCCSPQPVKENRKVTGYRVPRPSNSIDAPYFEQLYTYCRRDTKAMRELVAKLPRKDLIPKERKIWKMTIDMNLQGLPCDSQEVNAVLTRVTEFQKTEALKLMQLTENAITSPYQYARIKKFCEDQKFPIENCQGSYILNLLKDEALRIPEKVKSVLTLCQALGKTSTAKFKAFNNNMVPSLNGTKYACRVHDTFCYHGAAPGRWAGRGVQPQNFPRAQSKQPDIDMLRFINGDHISDPIELAKQLVRSVIKAPENESVIVADYKAIENRVLAWIAQDYETLAKFKAGHDQYIDMAAERFGRSYEDIHEGVKNGDEISVHQRRVGKVIILGCGFQMGWETFIKTAKIQFGLDMTEEEGQLAVKAYREKYFLVVRCWKKLTQAAVRAVLTGKRQTYGLITFGATKVNGTVWLAMLLPSGKSIYYHSPRVEQKYIPRFENMGTVPTITHLGVDSYNRKWSRISLIPGRITENAVQGTAREIMAHGMLNVHDNSKVRLIGTVHDEAIGLIDDSDIHSSTLRDFNALLCDVPFAKACPIAAEGYISKRYKKA